MDTFMDKLAQKLTAQEMIKANAAADAAELSRLKEQAAEYEMLFKEIQESSKKNTVNAARVEQGATKLEDSAARVDRSAAKAEENAQRIEALIAAGLSKIEELRAGTQDTEELKALFAELKQAQAEQHTLLTDHVHKESVKVYRNVQAVVVDETAKQTETNAKGFSSLSGKLGAVLGISIVALLTAVAGVVFQILVYLHII